MKNINNRSFKKVLIIGGLISSLTLTGCSVGTRDGNIIVSPSEKNTVEEISSKDNFDLLNDEKKLIIETENSFGEKEAFFVQMESLIDLSSKDYEKYNKYLKKDIDADSTYLYFDILNKEKKEKLVSVKYVKIKSGNTFKNDVITSSYKVSNIINSDYAYNYAVAMFGDKDKYSKEEIKEIIQKINNNELNETKTK